MDFTSLCTSPEPKLNSQVKLTPQHMGRCLGCVCPSPRLQFWLLGEVGGLLRKVVLGRALLITIIIKKISAKDSFASALGI